MFNYKVARLIFNPKFDGCIWYCVPKTLVTTKAWSKVCCSLSNSQKRHLTTKKLRSNELWFPTPLILTNKNLCLSLPWKICEVISNVWILWCEHTYQVVDYPFITTFCKKIHGDIKLIELVMVQIIGSMEYEHCSFIFTMMKNKLHNQLTMHLELVI